MKKTNIINAEYIGECNTNDFITVFQIHILKALKNREILTESAYEKGVSILMGRGK